MIKKSSNLNFTTRKVICTKELFVLTQQEPIGREVPALHIHCPDAMTHPLPTQDHILGEMLHIGS